MWGRKRAEREQRNAVLEGFEETVTSTDEAHEALNEMISELVEELEAIESMLGHDDGMPVDALRDQLGAAARTLSSLTDLGDQYLETRGRFTEALGEGTDAAMPWLEAMVEQVQGMVEAGEALEGTTEAVITLRKKLERLREDLIPLRERIHAAHRSAGAELAGAEGADGWFALQGRLAALSDRLRALDEGRVTPTPERKTTDHYRALESDLAQLRDDLTRAPR